MMEAAKTSETSVNFQQITRRNIPEDSHLHENVGSKSFKEKTTLESTGSNKRRCGSGYDSEEG
jgi:hypothetical protein